MVDSAPYRVGDIHVAPSATLWRDYSPKGWKYSDRDGTSEGAQKIQLKPGIDGRTLVRFNAGGPSLAFEDPAEPDAWFQMEPSVVVQMVSSTGACWTSEFLPGDVTSTGGAFKAHSK